MASWRGRNWDKGMTLGAHAQVDWMNWCRRHDLPVPDSPMITNLRR